MGELFFVFWGGVVSECNEGGSLLMQVEKKYIVECYCAEDTGFTRRTFPGLAKHDCAERALADSLLRETLELSVVAQLLFTARQGEEPIYTKRHYEQQQHHKQHQHTLSARTLSTHTRPTHHQQVPPRGMRVLEVDLSRQELPRVEVVDQFHAPPAVLVGQQGRRADVGHLHHRHARELAQGSEKSTRARSSQGRARVVRGLQAKEAGESEAVGSVQGGLSLYGTRALDATRRLGPELAR